MKAKHQFRIRDASPDRQPKIQSSPVRETLQRIMEQTNNESRFQIFISTNSLHQHRLLLGRKDSRLRYALVHNFLRNPCNGSKKGRWLTQWMILKSQILKYLMRGLLQRSTKSSIILTSKEGSVWRTKRHRSSTVSFAADRLLT